MSAEFQARRSGQGHEALPSEIYIPLVDSLYKDSRTFFTGSAILIAAILVTYLKTNEIFIFYCALAFFLVVCARGMLMRAYSRARSQVTTVEAARQWERRYVIGAASSVGLLGAWCFISFARTGDPFANLVSFTMAIVYAVGIFGRNFGNNRFVVLQVFCVWAPMTAALVLYGNLFHWVFAALLAPGFAA